MKSKLWEKSQEIHYHVVHFLWLSEGTLFQPLGCSAFSITSYLNRETLGDESGNLVQCFSNFGPRSIIEIWGQSSRCNCIKKKMKVGQPDQKDCMSELYNKGKYYSWEYNKLYILMCVAHNVKPLTYCELQLKKKNWKSWSSPSLWVMPLLLLIE